MYHIVRYEYYIKQCVNFIFYFQIEIITKKENKVGAMAIDMRNLITKFEILKKKKENGRNNKNGQSGMGVEYEDTESEHGDTDEESMDDSEQSEQNTDDEMDEDEVDSKVGYDSSDEESMEDSEQSEDMNDDEEMDDEIVNRASTSVFKCINTPMYLSRILTT